MYQDTPLLKAPEAARRLAISVRKLWELTNRGAIRCVRIGRAVRYDPADLRRWVDAGCPDNPEPRRKGA